MSIMVADYFFLAAVVFFAFPWALVAFLAGDLAAAFLLGVFLAGDFFVALAGDLAGAFLALAGFVLAGDAGLAGETGLAGELALVVVSLLAFLGVAWVFLGEAAGAFLAGAAFFGEAVFLGEAAFLAAGAFFTPAAFLAGLAFLAGAAFLLLALAAIVVES